MDKKYEKIRENFFNNIDTNKLIAKQYAKEYLRDAKQNNDNANIAKAYSLLSWSSERLSDQKIQYLDSAIAFGKKVNRKHFPECYYTKRGIAYKNRGNLKRTLDDYLEGLNYAKKSNNELYIFALKHNIALLKRKLGKYEEAKVLFKECLEHEEMIKNKTEADSLSYLITLADLVSVYRLNKQLDSAIILNKKGAIWAKETKISSLFSLNDGIHDYYKSNYQKSKTKIERVLPFFYSYKNEPLFQDYNLIDAYIHLGKVNVKLNKFEEAIASFKKVDSILKTMNYVIPEGRLAYVELIKYYDSIQDFENQLSNINRLLSIDSIINRDYKSVNDQLLLEYDAKELIEDKEAIISLMNKENTKFKNLNLVLLLVVIAAITITFYQYKKRKIYAKRFNNLISDQPKIEVHKDSNNDTIRQPVLNDIGISEDIVKALSEKIDHFEQNLGFLESNITTNSLAKEFNTNPKYISKVVRFYRQKSFVSYINDLRIDYALEKLKTDSKFRKYTIKAIAQEIGFNNTQSFSTYFHKKNGINPSYFINRLEKIKH
ncbi:AraC family transcriptional regulator [Aquimarina sp. D1M17]|uniref:helix-turn-helix domain-containing protein n=1 Tax=Aquimarina acroporae TaxID=2937283 RepID=UPI0020BFD354|nr:helix-turn-helix domain-containing protein [Aquimarina acroporae]MCK8521488.1 AraC family transcriptional regulator [Aquimarina acroporae]